MMIHRLLAFAIIALEAGLLGFVSRHWVFPVPVIAAALFGCAGIWHRRVTHRNKALAIFVGLPLVFVRWGTDSTSAAALASASTAMQGICQFILWAQLIDFFLIDDRDEPTTQRGGWSKPPWALPFSGVVVMAVLSSGVYTPSEQTVYIVCAALYVLLFVVYYALRDTARPDAGTGVPVAPVAALVVASLLVLGMGLGGGVFLSVALYKNLAAIDSYLGHLIFRNQVSNTPGFSRDATLGSVRAAKSSDANEVAVRVVATEKPGYLRACAFDTWDGSKWQSGSSGSRILQASNSPPATLASVGAGVSSCALRPAIPDAPRSLRVWPRTEMSGAYMVPLGTAWITTRDAGMTADDSLAVSSSSGGAQQAYDLLVARGADEWPGASALTPEMRERCTSLPETIHPGIRAMAKDVTRGCTTPIERIRAVERHMRRWRYEFGITVPQGRNPLEYFLLEQAPAHCEYFASGAAILLRLAGVPTRYVTGFVASERNPVGGHWLARNRDAHAWLEAWDDGDPATGGAARWVTVDATPPDGMPGSGATSLFDALWDHAKFLVARVGSLFRESGIRALPVLIVTLVRAVVLTTPGQVVLVLIAGAVVVVHLRRRRKQRPAPLPADLKALQRLLRIMDRLARRWGMIRRTGETFGQFATRICAGQTRDRTRCDAAEWYRNYAEVRYRPVRDPVAMDRLAGRLDELRRDSSRPEGEGD